MRNSLPPAGVILSVQPAICWNIRVSRTTYRDVRRDVYDSDNVTGADNQQERLRIAGWVTGFVDGEGCFTVPIQRQPTAATGWQVQPQFVVVQSGSSVSALEALKDFFGCGRINANVRRDNHRETMYRYIVRRFSDLDAIVVPFFRQHPLRTSKQSDFEKFATCVEMVAAGEHLANEGLIAIAEITETMNRQKPRRDLIRILRGHTPNIRDTG